ncbi:MAG: TIGR04282 family arsenosugar biosynthesis glycosyltransferase [Roseovarius sp.]|nr:TIGR04282 family arsenosugar biosynthesis glycosyltransferase [Roseovarius sp.]MCY4315689.1 TIGR04282 family arsenosugar biosynthesis glycosyltransferase [Roseovarius sp.]
MVKEPRVGRVKTRLGRDMGMVAAAHWYRRQTAHALRRLQSPHWNLLMAVDTGTSTLTEAIWPLHIGRVPQGGGNLGDRMGRIFRSLPPGPVCIIGSDIPEISTNHIHFAFKELGTHEAVIGPAIDGGFWLIGFKRLRRIPYALFANVRWSTEHAMADTLAGIHWISVKRIATLSDVDVASDIN